MILLGDYHTHTIYSSHHHGKGTIEQNVQAAVSKGLKEIAITDHGFEHGLYPVKRKNIALMRAEIERLKKIYKINILLGIECNLVGLDGSMDLIAEEEKWFDVVLVGYHKTAHPKNFGEFFKMYLPNYIYDFTGFITKKQIQKNTDAYLKLIEKNNIDIITHLNYGMKVDPVQIARLANQKGIYIELNGKRTIFSKDEINQMVDLKTKFIIDSDAHHPKRIGECNIPQNFAIMNKIPEDLIVNINKIPKFKKHREV